MNDDEHIRSRAVFGGIGLEVRRVDDGELGSVGPLPGRVGFRQEHVPREQVVPGELGEDADRHFERRISSRPRVEREHVLVMKIRLHVPVKGMEGGLFHRTVHAAPLNVVLGRRLAHDELVVR